MNNLSRKKTLTIRWWGDVPSSAKLNILGSGLLLFSLFLNWYSDQDVFRSGDTYTALNGPLYFVGYNIFIIAALGLLITFLDINKSSLIRRLPSNTIGKIQMFFGFFVMYLMIIVNSVYFQPQFGLNILSKRAEIGTMVALAATVLICVGGYMKYRETLFNSNSSDLSRSPEGDDANLIESSFETSSQEDFPSYGGGLEGGSLPSTTQAYGGSLSATSASNLAPSEATASVVGPMKSSQKYNGSRADLEKYYKNHHGGKPTPNPIKQVKSTVEAPRMPSAPTPSDASRRPMTDYERSQLYENMKKTMIKDSMTPEQRKSVREKEVKLNAFSADFGKHKYNNNKTSSKPKNTSAGVSGGGAEDLLRKAQGLGGSGDKGGKAETEQKKPQMYRMDL